MGTLIQLPAARVMRARVGGTVIDDAVDVMHVANAAVPFTPALWPRDQAPFNAWRFVRRNVDYIEEPASAQIVRFPWHTLQHGIADCKSTAILIAALCAACGCEVRLRYIVHPGETDFGHVYAIADGTAVDPLVAFGQELPYTRAEDAPVHHD